MVMMIARPAYFKQHCKRSQVHFARHGKRAAIARSDKFLHHDTELPSPHPPRPLPRPANPILRPRNGIIGGPWPVR
ncbi:hypothetical protein LshimejAT787_1004200 [Lyophyllum shimeji]|uniref:Uncharacterized protein n=1 Tax=Lyophyllum shimeji TaxID=47721 RepID=A0A9P3PS90_LYOSH|nr:hypothetical protein LshimejAT787_1004200 [Lyophyllum shimeji]